MDYERAHGNKIRLSLLPELNITSSFWDTTLEKPMWAKTNASFNYSDAISRQPTPRRIYVDWEMYNVGILTMFPETVGSLAWLYLCPLVRSPVHTMSQCYNRIPILYEGQIQVVDPIKRQTHPAANIQNCTDRMKKKPISIRHGPRRLMVYTNTWHCTPG